jgi:glycine cleavage system H protein
MTVILVITMIVVFLLIDVVYQKKFAKESVFSPAADPQVPSTRFNESEVVVPQSLFFGKGHTWVSLRSSGNVQIGVDDLMKKIVGKIDKISMDAVGTKIKRGDILFTMDQNDKKLNFLSPVSGIVYSLNDNMLESPEKFVNTSYEKSWLCTVKPDNLSVEIKLMKIAGEASKWMKDEMTRLKDFIAGVNVENSLVGATLHDGGSPVYGTMQYMDEPTWKKFEQEFLSE